MRKVSNDSIEPLVYLKDVSFQTSIVGFKCKSGKGWIEQSTTIEGKYTMRLVKSMIRQNALLCSTGYEVHPDELRFILNENASDIYLFDTVRELLKWLSEE